MNSMWLQRHRGYACRCVDMRKTHGSVHVFGGTAERKLCALLDGLDVLERENVLVVAQTGIAETLDAVVDNVLPVRLEHFVLRLLLAFVQNDDGFLQFVLLHENP